MFDSLSVPSVEVRMPKKGCQGHQEFRPATGNAGTWTCQRGAYEHGCEFAPVAGQNILPAEIPNAPYRSYTASAPGGQCRYPVKASGKTVYNQEKMYFRNAAILYPITYLPPSASEIHNHIVKFVLHKRAGLCNKNANITEETS